MYTVLLIILILLLVGACQPGLKQHRMGLCSPKGGLGWSCYCARSSFDGPRIGM